MLLSTAKHKKNLFGTSARVVLIAGLTFGLAGCDYVNTMFAPKSQEEQREEGMALGAGCRQAGQTLEDCYTRNPDSLKSGIYAGWKEMHEYMAAMNIDTANKGDAAADPIRQILDPASDKAASPAPRAKQTATAARAERDAERERRRLARERRESRQGTAQ
jgi:hypothetical protein